MLSQKLILGGVGAVIVIVAIAFSIRSNQEAQALKSQLEELQKQSPAVAQDAVNKLVEEVGKLIALPSEENPTVATITDKEKLKDVPFFTKAENGDKVLIYVNARKAFLYRVAEKKIIEVATLNLNTATQDFAAKVALRNGTDTAGLTKRFEDVLKQGLPKVEITSRDNAQKNTYADTLVIDLTGSRNDDAQKLATTINGKVASLPSDEARPEGASFLVIIGIDKAASPVPTASPAASPN